MIDVIVLYFLLASIFPFGSGAVQSAQIIFFTSIYMSWHFFALLATVFLGLSIFYQEKLRLGYIIYSSQR